MYLHWILLLSHSPLQLQESDRLPNVLQLRVYARCQRISLECDICPLSASALVLANVCHRMDVYEIRIFSSITRHWALCIHQRVLNCLTVVARATATLLHHCE